MKLIQKQFSKIICRVTNRGRYTALRFTKIVNEAVNAATPHVAVKVNTMTVFQ